MIRWYARLLLAAVLAGVLATAGGCSEARKATTTESTDTKVTAVSVPTAMSPEQATQGVDFAAVTWSPAEKLSPELEEAFTAALQKAGVVTLFPSTPPPLVGQTTGQFSIDSPPYGSAEALVVVRLPTVNPVVGVFSHGPGGQILTEGTGAKPITVRGQDGRWAPLSPKGVVVEWNEFGRRFFAEADGLDLTALVSWLDTWRPLPTPTDE